MGYTLSLKNEDITEDVIRGGKLVMHNQKTHEKGLQRYNRKAAILEGYQQIGDKQEEKTTRKEEKGQIKYDNWN